MIGGAPILLAYWPSRGRAEPIRLLLSFTGLAWAQKKYFDQNEWFAGEKQSMKAMFPNLPYIIDGGVAVTQMDGIVEYICQRAKRQDLLGKSAPDKIAFTQIRSVIADLKEQILGAAGDPSGRAAVDTALKEKVIPGLARLESFMVGKSYLIGSYMTYLDIQMYDLMDLVSMIDFSYLASFPNLRMLYGKIRSEPAVEQYLRSDKFTPRPYVNENVV
eukprot:TRINITY_DN11678_c0_g1_i1.p1 TRINITY_DN11678_c0_g1~~TRINITY_DN11678_c0_g1_i1.p1  ORF type:complete len:217 (+),score=15.99 TRINITY_DN11678_c0_g1_i1:167-817(+)